MTARFTASLLAFCLALPMCWCCMAVEQTVPETGCCAMMQHESCGDTTREGGQEPHCPCLRHEDSRDTADTALAVPAPELRLLGAVVWQAADMTIAAGNFPPQNPACHKPGQGPPGVAPPLYVRHCTLLI